MLRSVVVYFTGFVTVDVSVPDDAPDSAKPEDVLYAVQQKDVTELNLAVTDFQFAKDAS